MEQFILINNAKLPEDVFGTDPDTITKVYKKLVMLVHPDKHALKDQTEQDKYSQLFQKLQKLKLEADIRVNLSIYGTTKKTKIDFEPFTIKTKRHEYTLTELLEHGDISNVWRCQNELGDQLILKSVKNPVNNDLVKNEINMIKKINPEGDDKLYAEFFPDVIDSFVMMDATKKKSQVIVQSDYNAKGYVDLFTVKEVFKNNPDDEIVSRHLVWIFKRLLMTVGYLHNRSLVHGSVIPPHVLVHPVDHSIKLLDWSYMVKGSDKIKAISNAYVDFYPVEVMNKGGISGVTDIYMIVHTIQWLLPEDRMPLFMKRFFKGCLSHRHYDAWGLHAEFDGIVEAHYGEPKYIKLDTQEN